MQGSAVYTQASVRTLHTCECAYSAAALACVLCTPACVFPPCSCAGVRTLHTCVCVFSLEAVLVCVLHTHACMLSAESPATLRLGSGIPFLLTTPALFSLADPCWGVSWLSHDRISM